jgi:hypothetical protein
LEQERRRTEIDKLLYRFWRKLLSFWWWLKNSVFLRFFSKKFFFASNLFKLVIVYGIPWMGRKDQIILATGRGVWQISGFPRRRIKSETIFLIVIAHWLKWPNQIFPKKKFFSKIYLWYPKPLGNPEICQNSSTCGQDDMILLMITLVSSKKNLMPINMTTTAPWLEALAE